ncbi:toll/interleukin-1 receptor domain-containing protein [Chloroflexota bacterium]
MTNEELVALVSKCVLLNPEFQLETFFNEDSWVSVGEVEKRKAGWEVSRIDNWKHSDFQTFVKANRCTETNRRREEFIKYLKDRGVIHPKDFNPNQPYYEVAEHFIDTLLEAIENPSPLAGKIFGSCDVFISHATGDPKAEELSQALRNIKSDIDVYMTPELNPIEQGDKWPEDIIKHLKGAKIVVIVLTDESKKSCAVNQEIGYTLGDEKRYLVWFSTNTPSWILLRGDIQECSMSQWDAEKVANRIHEMLTQ